MDDYICRRETEEIEIGPSNLITGFGVSERNRFTKNRRSRGESGTPVLFVVPVTGRRGDAYMAHFSAAATAASTRAFFASSYGRSHEAPAA